MEKTPLLAVSATPVDIWYEGPHFVVADKPQGLAVHPDTVDTTNALVNSLLQSNRWLAEMETSHAPGVIHRLMAGDRGLVVVAKSDDSVKELRQLYNDYRFLFSYRVRLPKDLMPRTIDSVRVLDHQIYDEVAIWDIDTPLGDTALLRQDWLLDPQADAYFVCYRVAIPLADKLTHVALGERMKLPAIDLYTVPPCSICNGTKALLSYNGFGYVDHTLDNDATIQTMRQLRGDERGIPVIVINNTVSVGFDRHRLKQALGLY